MKAKEIIKQKINQKGEITVSEVVRKTGLSRVYVHRIIKKMVDRGELVKVGKTRKAKYVVPQKKESESPKTIEMYLKNKNLNEDTVWDNLKEYSLIQKLTANVKRIFGYAFTEILNNAIEHSQGKKIFIRVRNENDSINFDISDDGIGIFENIRQKRGLKNYLEAIQDLLKGKQTTMPKEHTGEGIFFTSKVADKMIIYGSKKKIIFDNLINDIFVKNNPKRKGTRVFFSISTESKKSIEAIFKKYTNQQFKFSKTKIKIKLYNFDTELISRSQARRMLVGLEKFEQVILDFEKVSFLGQGFADEVFRVWQSRYPRIKIEYINANENVEIMIKRSLS